MKLKFINIKQSKYTRNELCKFIHFCLSKLTTNKITDKLYIEIIFLPLDREYVGFTKCISNNKYPKRFQIEINKKYQHINKTIYKLIAHELTHVVQMATNKLKSNTEFFMWNDTKYNIEKSNYCDRPWEIEAFGRQELLYIEYQNILYMEYQNISKKGKP